MKNLAVLYYNEGYNCSQCILKAFEDKYSYHIEPTLYKSLNAVNTGLGVGSVCSAIVAGIMIFGLVFDDATAHRTRLKLLADFDAYYGSINCSGLNNARTRYGSCEKIISAAAYFTEMILLEEGFRQ
ncbi:MAG: hypothetical protein E7235_05435 [Lachnospiraceae bacterium]|nr:hypothetical protein [Lachnospiraceae bacterium]